MIVTLEKEKERFYYSFKIEGRVWPRDSYGYICMTSAETDFQNCGRIASYDIPQEYSAYDWNQNRPWIPSYYQNQENFEPQKRYLPGTCMQIFLLSDKRTDADPKL